MAQQDPNFPTARAEQAESTARGGAVVTPMRIAQLTLTVVLLLVATYLLLFAGQRDAWWWFGFLCVAVASILSLVTFRERT